MKRNFPKHAHAPRWHRHGADWHLTANGQPRARITRDGKRWLCYTADDIGDDGLLGFMPTLTAAKAYLARRAFAAMSHVAEREETPL